LRRPHLRTGHRTRRGRNRTHRGSNPIAVRSLAESPVAADARTHLLRALALVRQAPALLARGREAPERTSSVPRFADPIDLRIVPDHRMLRVHKDDLVILVHPVFADPVGIEDLEIVLAVRGAFFGDPLARVLRSRCDTACPVNSWANPSAWRRSRARMDVSRL